MVKCPLLCSALGCSGLRKGKVQFTNWEQYLNWDCDWDCSACGSAAAALAQLRRYHHRLAWTSASRLSADFAQKSIAWLTSRFVNVVVVVVAPLYTQWKLQQTVLIMPQLHNFNCNASLPMLGKLFYFLVWQTFPLAPFPHYFPFALSLCFFSHILVSVTDPFGPSIFVHSKCPALLPSLSFHLQFKALFSKKIEEFHGNTRKRRRKHPQLRWKAFVIMCLRDLLNNDFVSRLSIDWKSNRLTRDWWSDRKHHYLKLMF